MSIPGIGSGTSNATVERRAAPLLWSSTPICATAFNLTILPSSS